MLEALNPREDQVDLVTLEALYIFSAEIVKLPPAFALCSPRRLFS